MAFNHYHRKLNPAQIKPTVTLSVDWCPEVWTRARESAIALHIGLSALVSRAVYQYLEDNNLPDKSNEYRFSFYKAKVREFNRTLDPDMPPEERMELEEP